MREVLSIPVEITVPPRKTLLKTLGVGDSDKPSSKINDLLAEALDIYSELAEPVGTYLSITKGNFASVYEGEGKNEPETPLGDIFPRSTALALFAVTLGKAVSGRITSLFDGNDGAIGYTLDAVASEAAERAAVFLQERYYNGLSESNVSDANTAILRYSPGYCGWDISGQGKLFAYLEPGEIGITLNDSYLMQPLKSISGVFIAGDAKIHRFKPDYPFCGQCRTKSCLDRMRSLK